MIDAGTLVADRAPGSLGGHDRAAVEIRLPGARFATFEVCLTGDSQPTPPLPWSLDGTDSCLATAEQLRDTIASRGFETLEWVDETQWVLR